MSLRNYREYDTDERKVADLRFAVLGICLAATVLFVITMASTQKFSRTDLNDITDSYNKACVALKEQ